MEEKDRATVVAKKEVPLPPKVSKGNGEETKTTNLGEPMKTGESFFKKRVETVAGLALIISVISLILTLFVNFTGISPAMLETHGRIDEAMAMAGGNINVTHELKDTVLSLRQAEVKKAWETLAALKADPSWKQSVELDKALNAVKALLQ